MNRVTHKIILDIKSTISQQTLDVYLNDSARRLEIAFAEDNSAYKISSGCRAVFTAEKPDGTILYNDCAIIGNSVVFDFTQNPQIANVLGEVNCQVKLYGMENDLITSPRFTLVVHKTVYREGDAVESSSEFTALTKLITEANKALEDIGDIENILNPNIFPDSFELWNSYGAINYPAVGSLLNGGVLEPKAVYRVSITPGRTYKFTATPQGEEGAVFFAVGDANGICLDFTLDSISKYEVLKTYNATVPTHIYYGVEDINNIADIEFFEQIQSLDGKDGETPYIKDGYWWIGETNTNVKAEGKDGYTPVKGTDYFTEADKAELVNELASAMGYEGEYIVTPKVGEQALPTAQKYLNEDITISAIPYFETSNNSGGNTAYIAKEI